MIYLADKTRVDTPALRMVERIQTEIHIVLISRNEDLQFNEDIWQLKGKEYIVFDFIENGWNVDVQNSLIVGENTHDLFTGEGWGRLHYFLRLNPPKMYFKRELLAKDATAKILPVEYPNLLRQYEPDTKEQFLTRPISVFNYWGRSHEARLLIHGQFWTNAAKKGYAVCDNMYFFNFFMAEETNPNKWVTFHIPHYARVEIGEILKINGLSKLGLSLPGCGKKCFRTTEIIVNSIMVMPEDNLAYSYPFIHGKNCIKFPIESVDGLSKEWPVIDAIETALRRDDLYEIYLEGLKAAEFYQIDNYVNYLAKIINNA